MRALLAACVFGVLGAALLPSAPAKAWWDGYGRWHPDYYRPPVVVAPPAAYYPPAGYYPRPARWIRPHYDPWGRFIPGHWG